MFAKITMTVSKLGGSTEDFRNDLKGNSWLSGRRMTLEKRKILERRKQVREKMLILLFLCHCINGLNASYQNIIPCHDGKWIQCHFTE